jgi:L-arabinokinase
MVTFYVSGHGFGHATRAAAVIRALLQIRPDCRVAVRTAAPRLLFGPEVEYFRTELEAPVVESPDALHVYIAATATRAAEFLESAAGVIECEAEFLRASKTRLIVGDIPSLAGDIARRTSLPAVAIGNFTWDWIFAPAAGPGLLDRVRRGYSGYSEALRLPLCHTDGWDSFPRVTDVPLLSPRSRRPRAQIRAELGLTRMAVLLAGRSRLPPAVLERVRREVPDLDLLLPDSLPVFSDLVRAADVVVSKIGYSIAAECIAEGTRLLFPPRHGFREEEILAAEAPRWVPAVPLPVRAWESGEWRPWLTLLMSLPRPEMSLPANGDEVCARALAAYLA